MPSIPPAVPKCNGKPLASNPPPPSSTSPSTLPLPSSSSSSSSSFMALREDRRMPSPNRCSSSPPSPLLSPSPSPPPSLPGLRFVISRHSSRIECCFDHSPPRLFARLRVTLLLLWIPSPPSPSGASVALCLCSSSSLGSSWGSGPPLLSCSSNEFSDDHFMAWALRSAKDNSESPWPIVLFAEPSLDGAFDPLSARPTLRARGAASSELLRLNPPRERISPAGDPLYNGSYGETSGPSSSKPRLLSLTVPTENAIDSLGGGFVTSTVARVSTLAFVSIRGRCSSESRLLLARSWRDAGPTVSSDLLLLSLESPPPENLPVTTEPIPAVLAASWPPQPWLSSRFDTGTSTVPSPPSSRTK
mmetsp:Transcript_16849/g.35168  ORF Transcript_16849/g.35168 Transcript_16849/m.35168 type:complete len:360 (-) Transcript_16849:374-1453(-)